MLLAANSLAISISTWMMQCSFILDRLQVCNQEAVDIVRSFCSTDEDVAGLSSACNQLAELSVNRGCVDDITVLVIHLDHFVS